MGASFSLYLIYRVVQIVRTSLFVTLQLGAYGQRTYRLSIFMCPRYQPACCGGHLRPTFYRRRSFWQQTSRSHMLPETLYILVCRRAVIAGYQIPVTSIVYLVSRRSRPLSIGVGVGGCCGAAVTALLAVRYHKLLHQNDDFCIWWNEYIPLFCW